MSSTLTGKAKHTFGMSSSKSGCIAKCHLIWYTARHLSPRLSLTKCYRKYRVFELIIFLDIKKQITAKSICI